MQFNRFTRVALKAAEKGAEALVRHYSRKLKVDFKGAIDPVTDADRASQDAVLSTLKKAFPGHNYLSEEDTAPVLRGEYCWIIDPLDGTVNFIHRLPVFSVSIGLMHNGRIVSGVVLAPLLKETFVAEKGAGAFFNGTRISVSKEKRLVRSLVVTGFPYYIHSQPGRAMDKLGRVVTQVQGVRRIGSAALDLAYVAAGRFEAFWEEGLKPWDAAAGALLVTEAGGKITDFQNGRDYLFGKSLLASNGRIHKNMLALVQ